MLGLFQKRNYDWITVKGYDDMSIKEKLKYHKKKGEHAEVLPFSSPFLEVNSIYTRICSEYLFKQEKRTSFDIENFVKRALDTKLILKEVLLSDMPSILYKMKNGETLTITVYGMNKSSSILSLFFRINSHTIASIVGLSRVISFDDTSYRDEILEVINKIKEEGGIDAQLNHLKDARKLALSKLRD